MTTGAKGINVSKMTQTKRAQLPVLAGHWREGRKGIRKEELHWDEKGPRRLPGKSPPRRLSLAWEGRFSDSQGLPTLRLLEGEEAGDPGAPRSQVLGKEGTKSSL